MGQAEELMNLKAASRFLGCSPITARRLAKRGLLPSLTLPGTRLLRFRPAALREVIELSERKGAA
jgi:predicted site-specific integrase-resolvase